MFPPRSTSSASEMDVTKQSQKYIFTEFNAWTYNGSDNLWASLVEQLYTAVEDEFSGFQVRLHRAGIELLKRDSNGSEYENIDEGDFKKKKELRDAALFRFYIWTIMSFVLAITGVALGIWLILAYRREGNERDDCFDSSQAPSAAPSITPIIERFLDEENKWFQTCDTTGTFDFGIYGGIVSITLSPVPFFKQLFTFLRDVLPILRKGPKQVVQSVLIGNQFSRRDFSAELGFMGEVKTELEYLFDFLQVERKYDKATNTEHEVRLCIFVDDLDRCNAKTVVSVLEAVFLLLSESPITCYLAIDTRLVVASIDEHYTVHDRAGINGYDFLEKIIQLPFCVPDLTDSKKQAFINRLFLSGQLNPFELCSTITMLKKSSNLYPGIDEFDRVPPKLNTDSALLHLAKEFAKLDKKQNVLGVEHHNFLLEHDLVSNPEIIRELSNAEKESFLYHAAYFFQQVQEIALTSDDDKSYEETSEQDQEPEIDTTNPRPLLAVEGEDETMEEDDIEMHEIDFAKEFPWFTEEIQAPVPMNSMMTPEERKWFTEYASYISGKPRCITRVVNCYNLARYVAEKVIPEALYKNANTLKRKLMKLIILSEFWPYRTAFLMQVAEDIMQLSQLQGRNANHFDEKGEGLSLYDILPKLIKTFDGEKHCQEISLLCLYNRVVEPLLHSPTNSREAEKMLARDSDPQLFEHLLSSTSNITGSDSDLLRMKDVVVPFSADKGDVETEENIHLRYFVLNMSRHMLEYSSRCLDNLILYTEERYSFVDKCKREVLMYKHKNKYFTSGATPIDATNKPAETNGTGLDEPDEKDNEDSIMKTEEKESNLPSNEQEGLSSKESRANARHDVIFIRVKNAKGEIEKVIMSPMNEETTLAEHLEGYTKSTRSVHIDDDLFMWNEIKDLQAYYLPKLCGDRKMFTFTFVEG